MRTLAQAINSFHPVAATIESIEDQFRVIAEAVFNSGYFLVNKGKEERRIYPIDIDLLVCRVRYRRRLEKGCQHVP